MSNAMNLTFARPELAQAYCDSLEGKGIVSATNGLFLAGPRGVGKSTFLMNDLIPEIVSRDKLPIYVDLWADKRLDPALLVIEAIKAVVAQRASKLKKVARHISLNKIKLLGSVELDFSQPGLPDNITLAQLLGYLIKLTKKSVVLIIDEAQHALSSEDGLNSMLAIKSARDQLPELMLVFTGSSRDKLAQLIIKKDQPFFGSDITEFPLLGPDYSSFFTKKINAGLSATNQFSEASIWNAFQLTGHRPEMLQQIVGRVAISNKAESLFALLKKDASIWHSRIWQEYENDYQALPSLQQSILFLLIDQGRSCAPFSEEAIKFYEAQLGQTVKTPSVQTAVQALRDKGFVWQGGRGSYALEDEGFAQWFKGKN